jgi:hypothetical protein
MEKISGSFWIKIEGETVADFEEIVIDFKVYSITKPRENR